MQIKQLLTLVIILGVLVAVFKPRQTRTPNTSSQIVVGTSADFPPYSYKTKDNQFTGFDVELVQALADELHLEARFVDLRFEILIPELQLGSIDMVAACMTETPKRALLVSYTKPYAQDQLVIVSRANKPITTLQELYGTDVAVNEGYYADIYVSTLSQLQPLRLESVADAMFALLYGRVDAFVTARNTVQEHADRYNLVITPIPDAFETYSLAIAKNNPQLLTTINDGIARLQESGKLELLKKKWGLA